jgi:hypothetical protein
VHTSKCPLFYGWTVLVCLGLPYEVPRSHSDTQHPVELFWMSEWPVAKISAWQHGVTLTPCPRWDSNSQSQQASGRRPTHLTARSRGSAGSIHCIRNSAFKSREKTCRRKLRFINISCTSSGSHLQWSYSSLQGRLMAQLFRLFLKTLRGRFVVAYLRCDVARFFLKPGTS